MIRNSKPHGHMATKMRTVAVASGAAAFIWAVSAPAAASQSRAVATPFEVSESLAGNYLAAISAGKRRDTLAASTYFQEVLRRDPGNPVVQGRAFVATLANGDIKEAVAIARQIVRRDASNNLARLVLGVDAIKRRHFITARTQFARAKMNRPTDLTGSLLTAWSWQGSGKTKRALGVIESLNNPAVTTFRDYHAALVNSVARNTDEAMKNMKAAWDESSPSLRQAQVYAIMNYAAGNKEEALKALEVFDKRLPRHPVVVDAREKIKAGKKLDPVVSSAVEGAAEALYGLVGASGSSRGRELVPMIYLRLALYLNPEHDLAIVTLADIYERLKQQARAIDVYELMPKDSPLRLNADLQIGLTLESLDKKKEAYEHLSQIVARNPKDHESLLALANLHRSRKEFKQAAGLYTRALEHSPKGDRGNWTTYYFRAICYERMKEWPKAESDFREALKLYPDQPSVLNYLGYSWVDRGMNLEEAFAMLRKAVSLRPRDGAIVDSLGWAYYKLGKYQDALRELERAIELRPSDPVINDHLGDVYWKVGRKLEAKFQWNHARDLDPEPADRKRILRKIEVGLDQVEREEAEKQQAGNDKKPDDGTPAAQKGDKLTPKKNGG